MNPTQYLAKCVGVSLLLLSSIKAGNASNLVSANDLFLSVLDDSGQQSYTVDLGVSITNFIAEASSSFSIPLNSDYSTWATQQLAIPGHYLTYNIAAVQAITYTSSNPLDSLLMSQDTLRAASQFVPLGPLTNNQLSQVQPEISAHISDVNISYSYNGNTALVTPTSPDPQGYFNSTNNPWGNGQGDNSGNSYNSTTLGGGTGINELSMYYVTANRSSRNGNTTQGYLTGYFTLSADNTQLNWVVNSTVVSVPLINSAWLFLTGFISLLGWQKRQTVNENTL